MPPNGRPKRHASPLGEALPGSFINLSHNLRYVQAGYLASMDAELSGVTALPATRDLLAAFHPVVFWHKARRAGLPVAHMKVIEDEEELEAPCRLVPAHPYMWDPGDAHTLTGAKRVWNSVSMGGVQPVAMFRADGKPFDIRSFLGMTLATGKENIAWDVWRTFRVPLVRIHGFEVERPAAEGEDGHDAEPEHDFRITHLEPLRLADLTERDLTVFAEVSERPYSGVSWTA